mgnify:CR=1 FL=1
MRKLIAASLLLATPALAVLASHGLPITPHWSDETEVVVMSIRLPRILAALLVGAALSVSGAAYQGLFRNPMVSPDLLGVSAGAALGAALGHELTWEAPRGGFFLWTRLPEGVSSDALMPIALRLGVLYVTGEAFYVDGRGADHIRLAFSAPTPARIEEGVRRLARAISEARASAPAPAPLAGARS